MAEVEEDNNNQLQQQEQNETRQMDVELPFEGKEFLSKDLLHHLIGFFVSESGLVDGNSLRSCALVCRRWKEVVYSPSIWMIPTGLSKMKHGDSSMAITTTTTITTTQQVFCSIASSLAIRESIDPTRDKLLQPSEIPVESLIGFYNLGKIHRAADASSFRVKERATGRRCILSIAKDKDNSPVVIKELFQAHHVQAENFCSRALPEDKWKRKPHSFPLGVYLRKGERLTRWYDDHENLDDDSSQTQSSKCHSEKDHSLQSTQVPLPHQTLDETPLELDFSIGHLLKLERASAEPLDPSRGHMRLDIRASLIDWIVEIVEVFDLSDLTAFRAITFLDRIFSQYKARIRMSHFQLFAGSCLYIASKCEENGISSSDISFSADNIFSGSQIEIVENMLLSHLEWKLAIPVVLDFVLAYCKVLGLPENRPVVWMMRYIAELGLQSPIFLSYHPSHVAASVVVLSCFSLQPEGFGLWPSSLELESGYSWHELEYCTLALCRGIEHQRAQMPELTMIERRYRKPNRANVADYAIPSITSFATLTAYRERHSRSTAAIIIN